MLIRLGSIPNRQLLIKSQTYLRGSYLYIQQVHSYSVLSDLLFYFWIPKPSETTHQLISKKAAHNTVSTCSWENYFLKLIKNSFSLSLSNCFFFCTSGAWNWKVLYMYIIQQVQLTFFWQPLCRFLLLVWLSEKVLQSLEIFWQLRKEQRHHIMEKQTWPWFRQAIEIIREMKKLISLLSASPSSALLIRKSPK